MKRAGLALAFAANAFIMVLSGIKNANTCHCDTGAGILLNIKRAFFTPPEAVRAAARQGWAAGTRGTGWG